MAREVYFTHFDDDTGEQRVFAVTRLQAALEADVGGPTYTVPVDSELARWMLDHRGVEEHRLRPLMHADPAFLPPIIMCHMPGNSHLIVDGTHRYVAMALRGRRWIQAYLVEPEWWTPYLVDAPRVDVDTVMKMPSGL